MIKKNIIIINFFIIILVLILIVFLSKRRLPISAGILTHYAPKTLHHTLETYRDSGFIDCIDDLFVVIQKSDRQLQEKEVCEAFNVRYILLPDNGHMASGFKAIYKYARNDILLFLENDFCIYESKKEVNEFLINAISFIADNHYDIVRGRSRANPGEPNWGYTKWRKESPKTFINHTHLSECIYWVENPEELYPTKIRRIKPRTGNKSWYLSSSKSCNYTNNPFICRRSFFENNILPHLITGKNIEDQMGPIWSKAIHKCVFGPGLFTHNRSHDGHS